MWITENNRKESSLLQYYLVNETNSKALLHRTGCTTQQYNELLEEQNGRCKICHKHVRECKKRLAVDHNHITGEIRGLLCTQCNIGLGHFRDNPMLLASAILYLFRNDFSVKGYQKILKFLR